MSQAKLDRLTDALVEDILSTLDAEILEEVRPVTMAEIARAAWMAAPYPDDYWVATANAILEEVARANCEHCAKGKAIVFDDYLGVWQHATKPCASFRIWELIKRNPKHGKPVHAFTQS